MPPVGQISVIEKLDIQIHPIKVQIERRVGRDIQEYISPKSKRIKDTTVPPTPTVTAHGSQTGHSTPIPTPTTDTSFSRRPPTRHETSPTFGSFRRSLEDNSSTLTTPKLAMQRSSSFADIRGLSSSVPQLPSVRSPALRHASSNHNIRQNTLLGSVDGHREATNETQEMRARARKRTFLHIDLHGCVLCYSGNMDDMLT